jgi:hypothetical protein
VFNFIQGGGGGGSGRVFTSKLVDGLLKESLLELVDMDDEADASRGIARVARHCMHACMIQFHGGT